MWLMGISYSCTSYANPMRRSEHTHWTGHCIFPFAAADDGHVSGGENAVCVCQTALRIPSMPARWSCVSRCRVGVGAGSRVTAYDDDRLSVGSKVRK